MTYEQYRANKIETGLIYQDFVVDVLFQTIGLVVVQYTSKTYQFAVGESRTGVEIKHDEKFATTGNLWIEVAEKARPRAGDYVPSGIKRADNTWLYVIGNYDTIFAFPKQHLLALEASGRYPIIENNTRTSQGFLLRDAEARASAAFVLTPKAEKKITGRIRDLHELGLLLHEEAKRNPAQRSLFESVNEAAT